MLARHVFFEGRCQRSIEITSSLLDRAHELPYSDRRRIATNLTVSGYFGPASVDEAFRLLEVAAELVRDSVVSQAFLASEAAALLAMQGRADESHAESGRAEQLWMEVGAPAQLVHTNQLRGEAERFLGRPDVAEQFFRRGVEVWDELGETAFNSTMTALLAAALCDLGGFDEAETFVGRSRELSAEDDFASQSAWRMALARVLSHRGDHDRALGLADEAIAINASTDYLAWQAESDEVRGTVLAAAGRPDEALASFRSALERYERKGVVPLAAWLRERIASIEAP
jgi:tetratricopeptide (TPR) repeat protein